MNAVYLSGTGNTKHIVSLLVNELGVAGSLFPIESDDVMKAFEDDEMILAYPTQFSNIPYLVRDFICMHENDWKNKKVFLLTTMGLFSGDGTGCAARILRKYGAVITGGLQVKMPDAVCDSKALKKTAGQNAKIIKEADNRIKAIAVQMKEGHFPQEGLSAADHVAGLLGQRLWFYNKTAGYSSKLRIDQDKCVGCGICSGNCPTKNIKVVDGKAVPSAQCTMCYRCISHCPKEAITLLGKEVIEQVRFEKYVQE